MNKSIIDVMKPLQENENLKTEIRRLEGLILSFRMKIKEEWNNMPYKYNGEFLNGYDKHFGIVRERHGDISKESYSLTPAKAERTDYQVSEKKKLTKEEKIMYDIIVKKWK